MAAPRYLLDTNVLSHLLRHPGGAVRERITVVGEEAVCTSIIVACELRYGAAKKGSSPLATRVDEILSVIEVLPIDHGVDIKYGEIRTTLEKAGTPIGANDYLIAAHALATDLTLVTENVGEFSRVPGLAVENWL
ncbi:MAG: type II toxin-antitoxin system VapC family toxin [Candidatus Binatia bacterium]